MKELKKCQFRFPYMYKGFRFSRTKLKVTQHHFSKYPNKAGICDYMIIPTCFIVWVWWCVPPVRYLKTKNSQFCGENHLKIKHLKDG